MSKRKRRTPKISRNSKLSALNRLDNRKNIRIEGSFITKTSQILIIFSKTAILLKNKRLFADDETQCVIGVGIFHKAGREYPVNGRHRETCNQCKVSYNKGFNQLVGRRAISLSGSVFKAWGGNSREML